MGQPTLLGPPGGESPSNRAAAPSRVSPPSSCAWALWPNKGGAATFPRALLREGLFKVGCLHKSLNNIFN